ncbi:MAG: hypothetical protein KDA86_15340 [Planctomycetaceae bacterium]|nr:hypothetical protein [Planctomycetaceae bacterium]
MQKKLGRRIVVFARTIVFVWLLSVVAWLQKQDSLDLRSDVHDLKVIGTIEQMESAEEMQRLPGPMFENTLTWITRNRPEENAARVAVRTEFVQWLQNRGIDPEQMSRFSGKGSAPRIGATPFRVVRVLDLPERSHDANEEAPFWPSPANDDGQYDDRGYDLDEPRDRIVVTVAHLLDELEQLSADRQIAYATHVSASTLASKSFIRDEPSIVFELHDMPESPGRDEHDDIQTTEVPYYGDPGGDAIPSPDDSGYGVPAPGISPDLPYAFDDEPGPGSPRAYDRPESRMRQRRDDLVFVSGLLIGDQIDIHYEQSLSDDYGMVQQQDQDAFRDRSRLVSVPVETSTMTAASLLELTDPGRPANHALLALGRDPERMAYLRRTYGHMLLEDATGLASDGLTQAYRSLSLFGFSFSTRRFPMAVLVCLAAALWQTLAALIAARRQGMRMLVEIVDDATIEVLVSNRVARFALWIVLPLTALWASLPLVRLPDNELKLIIIGAGLLAMLGVGCVGTAESTLRPLELDGDSLTDQLEDSGVHTSPHFPSKKTSARGPDV